MGTLTLHAILEPAGPAGAIMLTEEQFAELEASTKVPPVVVTIDGHSERLRVSRMGGICIGFSRKVREAFGLEIGQAVEAMIEVDTTERTVEVPAELEAQLAANPALRKAYDAMAFSHRREYAEWVGGAKKQETRDRRAEKAIEMLRAGEKLS